jgi:hypothetical protein
MQSDEDVIADSVCSLDFQGEVGLVGDVASSPRTCILGIMKPSLSFSCLISFWSIVQSYSQDGEIGWFYAKDIRTWP